MFVRIRRLRRAGRRIPDHEAGNPEHCVEGDLQTSGGRFILTRHLSHTEPTDVLYDARVIAIQNGVGGMLVRGFEQAGDRAVLQEWEVRPLEQIIGPDGLQRWNWPK